MATLTKDQSSLPVDIFYGPLPDTVHKTPRIKIAFSPRDLRSRKNSLVLSVEVTPRLLKGDNPEPFLSDLPEVYSWITRNRSVLLKTWYGTISAGTSERLLESQKDEGQAFDEVLVRMQFLWKGGVSVSDIANKVHIPEHAAELIIEMNSKMFKDRKGKKSK